jgi:hypothetical protein
MVWEFAGDFISMGDTLEDRGSLLNAACSAWSIACNDPGSHKKLLDQYMKQYKRFNRSADEEELVGVRSNMEKLIQKKLEMFPSDYRQILGARIMREGEKDRFEVMSATVG